MTTMYLVEQALIEGPLTVKGQYSENIDALTVKKFLLGKS